jgi:hypothetical protein
MRRSLFLGSWMLMATIWAAAPASAQFYQARPLPAPAPPSLNRIGSPGQTSPPFRVQQFDAASPAPANRVAVKAPNIRPQTEGRVYWYIPKRLRRRW